MYSLILFFASLNPTQVILPVAEFQTKQECMVVGDKLLEKAIKEGKFNTFFTCTK